MSDTSMEDPSVTVIDRKRKCNAERWLGFELPKVLPQQLGTTWIIHGRCRGCGKVLAIFQGCDGMRKPFLPHCSTCHSGEHNACQGCGKCLPKFRAFWRSEAARIDRRFCSNVCRQKAYRARQAVEDARSDEGRNGVQETTVCSPDEDGSTEN